MAHIKFILKETGIKSKVEGSTAEIIQLISSGFYGIVQDLQKHIAEDLESEHGKPLKNYFDAIISASKQFERESKEYHEKHEKKGKRPSPLEIVKALREACITIIPGHKERLERVQALEVVKKVECEKRRECLSTALITSLGLSRDKFFARCTLSSNDSEKDKKDLEKLMKDYDAVMEAHREDIEAIHKEFPVPGE